ncbi:MAG TPA: EndoU domain-containing protein [Candidatus Xenobia bacterium]
MILALLLVLLLAGCDTGAHVAPPPPPAALPDDHGSPPIRYDHIFQGGINRRGEATGFHVRATGDGHARIIEGTQTAPDSHGVYQARVEVNDQGRWVEKPEPSTFYPDTWPPDKVLAEIRSAWNRRKPLLSYRHQRAGGAPGEAVGGQSPRWEGTSESGVNIEGYADGDTITTAYPLMDR